MLKTLRTGIVFASLLALITVASARPLHFDIVLPHNTKVEPFLADEGSIRSERSANISHIIGVSRKIQLIVNKIMYLQISPDGSVNGTDNDNDYTVLQRASLNNYQIRIQGVVTCNFLCMDRCGLLYGSKEFTDDCLFNEMMESHHFNTYSSAKYSNEKRTLYLALNKKGSPKKVQTKAKASLGKLETYTNVLTKPVASERVEGLALKIAKARLLLGKFLQGTGGSGEESHLFRHHRYQFCPNVPMTKSEDKNSKLRCRKKEKRKKKRKCRDDENDEEDCTAATAAAASSATATSTTTATYKKKTLERCEEGEEEEECQKRLSVTRQKRKSRGGSDLDSGKCPNGKCADVKEKKKRKRFKMEKRKMATVDKTVRHKCDNEISHNKTGTKGTLKGSRKEKENFQVSTSIGDLSTTTAASTLWRNVLTSPDPSSKASRSPSSIGGSEIATEKLSDDYYDDDQLDGEDEMSTETDWPLQSSSISLNKD